MGLNGEEKWKGTKYIFVVDYNRGKNSLWFTGHDWIIKNLNLLEIPSSQTTGKMLMWLTV